MKHSLKTARSRHFPNPLRLEWAIYSSIVVVAIFLRSYDLASRAMHHDESLHAYYSWELFQGSGLIHNPMLHGPLQMELTSLIFFIFGDTDTTSRLLYVIAGSILVILPIFIKDLLGRYGAISVSILLTISPTMVYFSRFARNDILMAVFTLGLVLAIWKYLLYGHKRYLYVISALLALSFSTKESAYLVVGTLGLYLTALTIYDAFKNSISDSEAKSLSYPNFAWFYAVKISRTIKDCFYTQPYSRSFTLLILLISLTLPQWSAFASIFQNTIFLEWSNMVLASGEGTTNIGMPSHGGKVLAFLIVIGLLMTSAYMGYKWHWKSWFKCALIFYAIWLMAYTTMFTNITGGVQSGIWQSLGYWIVQQGEGRGGQPTQYYLFLIPIYEYLPAIFTTLATFYYIKSREKFNLFLLYWMITTLFIYTVASEKMPWLLVNIALPMIVLGGKFIGDLVSRILLMGKPTMYQFIIFIIPALVFALILFVSKYSSGLEQGLRITIALAMILCILSTSIWAVKIYKNLGKNGALIFLFAGAATLFLLLTIRTTIYTNYVHSDIPVEMLVYTQTSPDVHLLHNTIQENYSLDKSGDSDLFVIDQTNGFTWPWSWYLRNHKNVLYPKLNPESYNPHNQAAMVIVHSSNHLAADRALSKDYTAPIRIPHRWWFPEHTYRDLNTLSLINKLVDTRHWNTYLEYWLFRKGVGESIGSEDAYLYTKKDFPKINFGADIYRK